MTGSNSYPRSIHHDDEAFIIVFGFLVVALAFMGYVLLYRIHIRPGQLLEISIYLACSVTAVLALAWHLKTAKKRAENIWPHPSVHIPLLKDDKYVTKAFRQNSIVLGYDVHRRPWLWPDDIRVMQGLIVGQSGAGKTTLLRNIITQDLRRTVTIQNQVHRVPLIIFDGKGDQEFLTRLLPEIAAAGRMHQLRILDPSRPEVSARYNPCYAPDGSYLEHANLIFQSFGMRVDFFAGHQATYFTDLSRIAWHTGKRYNIRDLLVMAYDERVLKEQMACAAQHIERSSATADQFENFRMSCRNLQESFRDRERLPKIQGLLNELLTFIDDHLSILTGPYQELLTLEQIIDEELILFVSLNLNRNNRAVAALGRMILQNLQLMVGKRYQQPRLYQQESRPMVSIILDEFAAFAYPNFAQILQTARGSHIAFLFSLQSISQLLSVSRGFRNEVASAPNTIMMMRNHEEETVRYFLDASARIEGKRKTTKVHRKGILDERWEEQDEGSLTEIQKPRAEDFHIKNLPVGQMQVLQTDNRLGTLHSHLHVRRPLDFPWADFEPLLFPRLVGPQSLSDGANLKFSDSGSRRGGRAAVSW